MIIAGLDLHSVWLSLGSAGAVLAPFVVWVWAARLQALTHGLAVIKVNNDTADGAAARLNQVLDQVQQERDATAALAKQYLAELERVRVARYGMEDMVSAFRDQVLAARAMVHELERRFQLPETKFDPLPYPGLGPRDPA